MVRLKIWFKNVSLSSPIYKVKAVHLEFKLHYYETRRLDVTYYVTISIVIIWIWLSGIFEIRTAVKLFQSFLTILNFENWEWELSFPSRKSSEPENECCRAGSLGLGPLRLVSDYSLLWREMASQIRFSWSLQLWFPNGLCLTTLSFWWPGL